MLKQYKLSIKIILITASALAMFGCKEQLAVNEYISPNSDFIATYEIINDGVALEKSNQVHIGKHLGNGDIEIENVAEISAEILKSMLQVGEPIEGSDKYQYLFNGTDVLLKKSDKAVHILISNDAWVIKSNLSETVSDEFCEMHLNNSVTFNDTEYDSIKVNCENEVLFGGFLIKKLSERVYLKQVGLFSDFLTITIDDKVDSVTGIRLKFLEIE